MTLHRTQGLSAAEGDEPVQQRGDKRRLEMENEILKPPRPAWRGNALPE